MGFECPECHVVCKNRTTFHVHLKEVHPNACVFSCQKCQRRFKHKSSLARHTCKDKVDPRPSKKQRPTIQHRVSAQFANRSGFRQLLGQATDFGQWAVVYQSTRTDGDVPLSQSTVQNIESTWTHHFAPDKLPLPWEQAGRFCDAIDQWIDERYASSAFQPITTANHLRHLQWYAKFMYSRQQTDDAVLDYLEDVVQSTQHYASKATTDGHCIAMLDPYQLAKLRDHIVAGLQKQQRDVLDPFIERVYRAPENVSSEELVTFGLVHLRCWLDLAMRFATVPLRMQCTIHLLEPTADHTDFVAKLSYRQGKYVRIIYHDKTGDSHAPAEVPIGREISAYLTFYRHHCRPLPLAPHTFQTKSGSVWKRASADVKEYTRLHLHIEPERIEPTGRFVHGSRHIGLATYALAVNFDSERLRELAHLMRHSVAVSEKYYSVWLDRNRNERASTSFARIMGLDQQDEETDGKTTPYRPLTLRPPSTIVRQQMVEVLARELAEYQHLPPEQTFELRDASTQTGPDPVPPQTKHHWTDSCTLPKCTTCTEAFVVLGPLGQSRHSHYGQYFAQCMRCHGKRPVMEHAVWYQLGYTPGVPSRSQQPRNHQQIQQYILCHATKT